MNWAEAFQLSRTNHQYRARPKLQRPGHALAAPTPRRRYPRHERRFHARLDQRSRHRRRAVGHDQPHDLPPLGSSLGARRHHELYPLGSARRRLPDQPDVPARRQPGPRSRPDRSHRRSTSPDSNSAASESLTTAKPELAVANVTDVATDSQSRSTGGRASSSPIHDHQCQVTNAAGSFRVRFLLAGSDGSIDNTLFLADATLNGLAAGATQTYETILKLPSTLPPGVTLNKLSPSKGPPSPSSPTPNTPSTRPGPTPSASRPPSSSRSPRLSDDQPRAAVNTNTNTDPNTDARTHPDRDGRRHQSRHRQGQRRGRRRRASRRRQGRPRRRRGRQSNQACSQACSHSQEAPGAGEAHAGA